MRSTDRPAGPPREPVASAVAITHRDPDRTETFRTTARVVGLLYLAGMVVGIGGDLFIESILTSQDHLATVAAKSTPLALGVVLWLATVVGDAAHGIVMYPVLKRRSERTAVAYLVARIIDATFIAVMALLIVIQIPVSREYLAAGASGAAQTSYLQALSAVLSQGHLYAYEIAMTALGVAGLILSWALLRANLVPRPLAMWGIGGYAVLLIGSVLQIFGFHLNSIHAIPGGLWELFIGIWLIVKGFTTKQPIVRA